jgi:hypothetical protein
LRRRDGERDVVPVPVGIVAPLDGTVGLGLVGVGVGDGCEELAGDEGRAGPAGDDFVGSGRTRK